MLCFILLLGKLIYTLSLFVGRTLKFQLSSCPIFSDNNNWAVKNSKKNVFFNEKWYFIVENIEKYKKQNGRNKNYLKSWHPEIITVDILQKSELLTVVCICVVFGCVIFTFLWIRVPAYKNWMISHKYTYF